MYIMIYKNIYICILYYTKIFNASADIIVSSRSLVTMPIKMKYV